jgi:hypothetical protein
METMSKATKTNTQSPALHGADSHDLIRVHGARVNHLKDISVELRRYRRVSRASRNRGARGIRGGHPPGH